MIRAKKSLGQNFLINKGIIKKITDAAEIKRGETIIEVGPGTGVLTKALVEAGANVIAIEKDHRLIADLKNKFSEVKFIESDVLKLDIEELFRNSKLAVQVLRDFGPEWDIRNYHYKVVGNLPYYITSHFLRTMLEEWPKPDLAVLMVQKEVAQRIMAKPPHMNLLALSVQFYAEPKIISYVSRGSFRPIPKVDSALLRIKLWGTRQSREVSQGFFKLIKTAFAGKRKQLKNTVSLELLEKAGINPELRPEKLSLDDWIKIISGI